MSLATQRVVIACFCAAALAAVGCADGSVNPVSPSASRCLGDRVRTVARAQRPSREAESSM